MEASFKSNNQVSKAEQYDIFLQQFASLIEGETHEVSVLANTCAALKEAFEFFWVGFYLVENDELVLGPFQGSVACYRIKKGRGVCGTAWAERRTLVVPMLVANEVKGVLDIDSDCLNAFDETDREALEKIVTLLIQTLYQK